MRDDSASLEPMAVADWPLGLDATAGGALRAPTALWMEAAGRPRLRRERPCRPAAGEIGVRTLFSGISRGTESLVFSGEVPQSEFQTMRAPFQAGDFSFPVKYGYAAVGIVEKGASELAGRAIFCLHPHQDRFVVPANAVHILPKAVPPERAILAANMETALTVVWDAGIGCGDRVAVIGGGVVGLLVAALAAAIPGTETTLVDINPARRDVAKAVGVNFAEPDNVPDDCDVCIHASGAPQGLATAIAAAGIEARIVEASWYGSRSTTLCLGGAFHSRRLSIVASQVGAVPPGRRARWSRDRRMERALALLGDPRFDVLVSGESAFAALPTDYAAILSDPSTLCHRIVY